MGWKIWPISVAFAIMMAVNAYVAHAEIWMYPFVMIIGLTIPFGIAYASDPEQFKTAWDEACKR